MARQEPRPPKAHGSAGASPSQGKAQLESLARGLPEVEWIVVRRRLRGVLGRRLFLGGFVRRLLDGRFVGWLFVRRLVGTCRWFRVAGHRLHVTHTDGNPLQEPVAVDAIPIAPSERYDAVLIAEHPGAWLLHCTQPGHAAAGEQMLVVYDGHADARPVPAEPSLDGLRLWQYSLGRGRAIIPPADGATRTFEQTLSGGMMGSDVWTINGKVWPRTDPLPLKRGERAVVRFRNMSMEAHPMHLHGQSFRVLAINGAPADSPLVKDSIDVDGHMGSAVVEFTAHNPGDWLLHCHKPMHMDGGMISLVKVG